MGKPRKRPFTMPWGGGQVVEELGVDQAPPIEALLRELVEG